MELSWGLSLLMMSVLTSILIFFLVIVIMSVDCMCCNRLSSEYVQDLETASSSTSSSDKAESPSAPSSLEMVEIVPSMPQFHCLDELQQALTDMQDKASYKPITSF